MVSIVKRTNRFLKRLDGDESAPNTVEWVLLIIVALIVMTAIYFIAQWVLGGGATEAKKVDTGRASTTTEAEKFKNLTK